ncbi:hypothetical protein ES708_33612 [subsurface metagenome]
MIFLFIRKALVCRDKSFLCFFIRIDAFLLLYGIAIIKRISVFIFLRLYELKKPRSNTKSILDNSNQSRYSTILWSVRTSGMRKEGINKDLTVQELMYEFKKIKLIRLGAKKTIVTEVSKKQRELFQSFKINPPIRP